jgi:hypothetical protein
MAPAPLPDREVAPSHDDARRHLEELADRIAAADDVLEDCREARDRAMVAYVEAGIPQVRVAVWAKVDKRTVARALARPPVEP